jgi:hypothetical protein
LSEVTDDLGGAAIALTAVTYMFRQI